MDARNPSRFLPPHASYDDDDDDDGDAFWI
jgi:hypothetical protein